MADELFEGLENIVVEQTLERIKAKWLETLAEYDKIVSGATAESIEVDVKDRVVGATDESAFYIEFGTEAGTDVPLAELEKWAAIKFGVSGFEMKRIAKQVHKKIMEEGVEETRMVYIMLEQMVANGTIARFSE